MGAACSCFDDGSKEERRKQERLASQEARVKAAEAAERRKQEFDQSAAGRAARVQIAANARQTASDNRGGEPVLKWQMG